MNKPVALSVFLLVLASLQKPVPADQSTAVAPREYTAVYEVLRNGEQVANITLDLSRQGDEWAFHGFTHDMRGLGKLLDVEGRQGVTGKWRDGSFHPDKFTFSFSLVGFRSRWQADFDWTSGTVSTGKKSKKIILSLADGAMDPMSLLLNTGQMLSEGRSRMEIFVVDEDEIENHLYEAEPGVRLDTALGCMDATRVRRIRKNPKRTSLAWYASDYGYIPVGLHHYKKNGNGLEVRIKALQLEGRSLQDINTCQPSAG